MATRKPWMKWYGQDWMGDIKLRACSAAARGIWADLCSMAQEGEPFGHVTTNGKAPTMSTLARWTGTTEDECAALISELEGNRVFSRTRAGVIYSRKMVRMDKQAQEGRKWKKAGLAQDADKPQGKRHPSRVPSRVPSPQRLEARYQKESLSEIGKPISSPRYPSADKLPMNGSGRIYPEGFEAFWRAYRVKRGAEKKPSGYEKWRMALKQGRATEAQIIEGAKAYAAYLERTDEPARLTKTWLHNDGWAADYGAGADKSVESGDFRLQPGALARQLARAPVARSLGRSGREERVVEAARGVAAVDEALDRPGVGDDAGHDATG